MNTFTLERNNYRRKLIMLVKQHPILWNKTHKNYVRNRPQKVLAWHQISEQLGITVDKLRRTWENLRDQYRRDLKREVRFGFKSKWRFYNDMNFIRDMVSCKENDIKENENDFTDTDSELDVTENQHIQLQCSPVTTTLVAAPTTYQIITTPINSTITSNTTCSSNGVAFQPIMLSKQWQTAAENGTQIHNQPPTNSCVLTIPQNSSQIVDVVTNCDSSKDCAKLSSASEAYEIVTKQEPDHEMQDDIAWALPPDQVATPTKNKENNREFQEPCVSTSSQKRSLAPIETISDMPTTSNAQLEIKSETNLNIKDDDYFFAMSLLPSLRQIPRSRKIPLRIGIMSLIAKDLEHVCKE